MATSQRLPLRSEFVHSLCIAEQLGVLKSIENIAKSLHTRTPTPSSNPHASLVASKDAESAEPNTESEDHDVITGEDVLEDDLHSMEEGGRGGEENLAKDIDKLRLSPGTCGHESKTGLGAAANPNSVAKNWRTRLHGTGSGSFLK